MGGCGWTGVQKEENVHSLRKPNWYWSEKFSRLQDLEQTSWKNFRNDRKPVALHNGWREFSKVEKGVFLIE